MNKSDRSCVDGYVAVRFNTKIIHAPRSSMPQDHIRMSYGTVAEYVDVLWGKEEGQ